MQRRTLHLFRYKKFFSNLKTDLIALQSTNLTSTFGAFLDVRKQFVDTGTLPNPTSNTSGVIDK